MAKTLGELNAGGLEGGGLSTLKVFDTRRICTDFTAKVDLLFPYECKIRFSLMRDSSQSDDDI